MSEQLPKVHLVRHGETAWTVSKQHTGLTDLPLTERGERDALRLGEHLKGLTFACIFTSPLQRAKRTSELAGFGAKAEADADLVEWDYGDYEGLTSEQIHQQRPDWQLFRDGCPGGESVADIGARADRFIARIRAVDDAVLVFASSHIMRVIGARWLGLDASCGRLLFLSTTTLSVLGYEHNKNEPVISLWNDVRPGLD
jgi:broad specificity phosphatase PhoE